jgi:gas vesicle protein
MSSRTDYQEGMDQTSGVSTSRPMEQGVGGFFIGFLTGIAVAGVLGLLYAPKSGQETRNSLKNEFDETQRMFQNWGNDVRERVDSFGRVIRFNAGADGQSTGNGHQ